MSEFVKHDNEWKSYWILTDLEKVMFKFRLLSEHLMWAELEIGSNERVTNFEDGLAWALKWTEHQYPYMITALTTDEEHYGDCRQQCTSCIKCHAEDIWNKVLNDE